MNNDVVTATRLRQERDEGATKEQAAKDQRAELLAAATHQDLKKFKGIMAQIAFDTRYC